MEKLPSVINVVSDERADNYMYLDGGDTIQGNHDILVVSEERIDEQLGAFHLPYNVKDGDVLVRNIYELEPYYVLATDAAQELWKGRCMKVIEVMGRLSAVQCEFESCKVETSRRERGAEINGQYKLVKLDTKVNQDIEKTAKETLIITSTNKTDTKPFELTHEEWEEVRAYAKERGLWQETTIRDIINAREPGIKGREIDKFSLVCNVSSDCNKILDVAFGLSGCGAFSLNAEVQDKISLHYETTVTYSVQF